MFQDEEQSEKYIVREYRILPATLVLKKVCFRVISAHKADSFPKQMQSFPRLW